MKNRFLCGLLTGCFLLNLSAAAFASDIGKRQIILNTNEDDIAVNAETFDDELFRNWILDADNLGGIGEDGILTYEERKEVKSIDISRQGITSLKGIEVFTEIEELDCSRNNLTSLDISQNTRIKTLNCSYNLLTELSVENQTELNSLNCNFNRLESLDVSNKDKLRALSCEYNYINQLDITGNTTLEWLNIRNNLLTELHTETNSKLKVIEAFDNKLTEIDVSSLKALEYIDVSTNRLTSLDLSQNTNLSSSGSGFSASNNLLTKILLPVQNNLNITPDAYAEQDPITGYDRVKWYLDEDLTIEVTEPIEAQGQTLYSKRIANEYTIYFSGNGANGTMDPQKAIYGEEVTLKQSAFTRTGYIFNGWNTLSNGNGNAYEETAQVNNLAGKYNGDRITLYAQWKPIEYTIVFDANSPDAQGSMENQTAVYNQDLTLNECKFTLDGKEFAGWSRTQDGPVRYLQSSSVRNLASQQGETTTLYAVWKTPVEELQKPFLTELEQNFNSYSGSDYTAEDWDLLSSAYEEADALIRLESDPDQMKNYSDNAIESMGSVMTKEDRIKEIVNNWKNINEAVLQNLNKGALHEDNSTEELENVELTLREMTAEQLKKHSTLSQEEDLDLTSGEALEEVNVFFEDLMAYMNAAKWVVDLEETAKRPLNQVTTANFEQYQTKTAKFNLLTENEKNQIDSDLTQRLKERTDLVTQKQSAIGELQGVYYSIDQGEYNDYSREILLKALENGIKNLESSESSEQIALSFVQSRQELVNVSPDEEVVPDDEDSDNGGNDDNNDSDDENDDNENNDDNNGDDSGNGGGSGSGNGSGGGSSSGGGSGNGIIGGTIASQFNITVLSSENGVVASSLSKATKGIKVTLTVTPDKDYILKSLKVTDKLDSEINLSKESDEKYTFIMPGSAVTVSAAFGPNSSSFSDVATDSWYHDAVLYVTQNGLFNGIDENLFAPDEHMTRAMLMTVLYRKAGEPQVEGETEGFLDVDDEAWYHDAVIWAKQNGITTGEDGQNFAPHKKVTREQFATILHRYMESPSCDGSLEDFSDAHQAGDFATEALKWAVHNKIMSGKGDGILDPGGEASRAQAAQMLMNLFKE